MSNHNEEVIYTQDDMDAVLEKLRAAEREAELSRQLLWATVQVAGGHVEIPYSLWAGESDRNLAMWDDPETYKMNLQVAEVKEAQDV